MKLLLIAYEYPPVGGGTGKVVMNTARQLARMGHETAVLTARFGGAPRREAADGVRIFRIPVLRRHINYANAAEVLSFAASGLLAMRGVLKEFRPDLALAYHTIPSGIVSLAMKKMFGVPYFTLLRGQDVPGSPETPAWMHKAAWPVTRAIWNGSARVVANSDGLAEMARAAMPGLSVGVARNGIDLDLYRPENPEAGGIFRAVYLGRLTRAKRLRELVEAWAEIARKYPSRAELCFAGFGFERQTLERMAAELGVAGSVKFLGRLEEPEVIALLQRSHALVNISAGEGLPNVVLEAMACGLPVVLSDIPPHRELIGAGEAGTLCDGADRADITRALASLIENPARARQIGARGRQIAEEKFGWAAAAARLAALFPRAPEAEKN